jgi:hypothetical protein
MVPSSSITDGECLTCGGFSLDKPIHLGNFKFIADYFGGLSLSPWRGNDDTIFVGSTHSGASTPQRATMEDSTEEFLTASSRKGSLDHPSPRRRSTGASFAPATTTTRKVNSSHDEVSPADGGAAAENQPPLRAASCSPRRTADASPCSAFPHRARVGATAKWAHRQEDRYGMSLPSRQRGP